jgi:cytochrome oxidase Cu insertion factor (SCO1/SenC/PrrC family)
MADTNGERSGVSGELTEEQRASLFSAANTPADRGAAFRAGRVPVPPKFVLWTVAVLVLIALGGEIIDHYFGSFGGNVTPTSLASPGLHVTSTTNASKGVNLVSLEAFMGLKFIGSATAGTFSLTNQADQPWSLAAQQGNVVILTFYNSICNDICPVLGAEIREAHQLLGHENSKVVFAIVNTDPKQLSVSSQSEALSEPGLSKLASVSFLTGSLATLDQVWTTYGVKINVGAKANEVTHNNVLYFIGADGNLDAYATPFATESNSGHFSLSSSVIHHYAEAIAETAVSLVP